MANTIIMMNWQSDPISSVGAAPIRSDSMPKAIRLKKPATISTDRISAPRSSA